MQDLRQGEHANEPPTGTGTRNAAAEHRARRDALKVDRDAVERRSRTISTLRLMAVLAALGLLVASGLRLLPGQAAWGAGISGAVFLGLVVWHVRLDRRLARIDAGMRFHDLALLRLGERWAESPTTGERFVDENHPYASDLALFGKASLFQVLDETHTHLGEELLASWLLSPASSADIAQRQDAARDLSRQPLLLERLAVEGQLLEPRRTDLSGLFAWAETSPQLSTTWAATAAVVVPALTLGSLLLYSIGVLEVRLLLLAFLTAWLVNASFLGRIERVWAAVGPHARKLMRFRDMFALLEEATYEAPMLLELRRELVDSTRASDRVRKLAAVMSYFEARENEVFKLLLGPLVLWDVHCVRALERWQQAHGRAIGASFHRLAAFEALASLGNFAADHPDYAWPRIAQTPTYRAAELGHPLLAPDRRVCNDVELHGPGTALLVTGSNMSGKSTLLRAIGLNAVLALAGAPVCARSLELGIVGVRASMSAHDSLARGVSFFYAEVEKLKRVVDGLSGPAPLFFLLDEILQGTNSRERSIGARSVLKHLVEHGAMGAVSTHDVNLWQLGSELDAHLIKVHLEEQVEGDASSARMSFDYRLKPGVVKSSNALRLMKLVGIDLDFE